MQFFFGICSMHEKLTAFVICTLFLLITTMMDAAELRTYEQQLNQVRTALEADPSNKELHSLEDELQKIIDLNKELINSQNASSSSSSIANVSSSASFSKDKPNAHLSSHHQFVTGEECQAKYEADGRWYPARIVSVSGSNQNPMYTILFKGYNETAIVQSDSLKPTKNISSGGHHRNLSSDQTSAPSTLASTNKLTPEEEQERERKKKRSEKKNERFANRTAEAQAVQNSWQKFAKKAEKKGHLKKDKSMFKTPDDPLAKVGVIGAGRGMTNYGDRKKHTYGDEAS